MTPTARDAPRFRGRVASAPAQQMAGFVVVALLVAAAVTAVVGGYVVLAVFTIGAGAGYSLSGSV